MASPRTAELRRLLARPYPWAKKPFIVGAPMRIMAGPQLAVAVSAAGGLGFIGPQAKPDGLSADLDKARELVAASTSLRHPLLLLPVGVGYQVWNGDLKTATSDVEKHRPCAVWLFAPRNGQSELDEWTVSLRGASRETQIWIQVGTLSDAVAAVNSSTPPDVLVVQGTEAGGHGMVRDTTGTIVLFPEVADAVKESGIPVVAAGGIIDGRGAAAALALGAAGVAMGTRFLASSEARIAKGYQDEVVRASDGAKNTLRTQLYNHLRGTFGWPEQFSPRTLINRSWIDHEAGVPFEKLQVLHDEAAKSGDAGWGPEGRLATYVGAGVGLVRSVQGAGEIVESVRNEARDILKALSDDL
ncbi:dehydrogenase [Trichoderma reesei QM6a]|uniref:Dehydrogenase n=2 Tax=Hypocrea jecorina TaxID=51453 RepID=G0RSU0_HYPJQ|nr:dehydrogenase [Trichoderma reesei QM6a]EGR45666.1 dehydrogenase [Trichoderma reesei QM6a]ETS01849.1 2-nitropropane dioxygenase precursor [Trichoderma reesei RUT C-30]